MYYEEVILAGILMYRTRPDGKWVRLSVEKMTEKIVDRDDAIADIIDYLRNQTPGCVELDEALKYVEDRIYIL